MKPAIIIGIVIAVILVTVGAYFALRGGDDSPPPSPSLSPTPAAVDKVQDGIDNVVDKQIEEIANDVANSAREGYISRREYMTPTPSPGSSEVSPGSEEALEDLTRIVLKNILGKPVKAIVAREEVSGILKVVMTGVDPNVFEPALDEITTCASKEITESTSGGLIGGGPKNVMTCVDNYFSENPTEFQDTIMPAALTMWENGYNEYAPPAEKEQIASNGGLRRMRTCRIKEGGAKNPSQACIDGPEDPKITWDAFKTAMRIN